MAGRERTAVIAGEGSRWTEALARDLGAAGWRAVPDGPGAAGFPASGFAASGFGASGFGAPELLIWAAPAPGPGTEEAAGTGDEAWSALTSAFLDRPFRLARAMAAGLPEGAGGSVVFLLDPSAWDLPPGRFGHSVGHMALWALARGLARSLAPRIRVNAIGLPPAAGVGTAGPGPAEIEREACRALRYLLSAEAVTGQLLPVDGGAHPTAPPGPA
jgi:NAD(P)-dependent dehydrogenase (short-subunit alcohol dehydrogenase family)